MARPAAKVAAGEPAHAPGRSVELRRQRSHSGDGLQDSCIHKLEHLLDPNLAAARIETSETIGDIRSHIQVREERGLLRHKSSMTVAGLT